MGFILGRMGQKERDRKVFSSLSPVSSATLTVGTIAPPAWSNHKDKQKERNLKFLPKMNEYESMEVSVRTGSILQLKTTQTPCLYGLYGHFQF